MQREVGDLIIIQDLRKAEPVHHQQVDRAAWTLGRENETLGRRQSLVLGGENRVVVG